MRHRDRDCPHHRSRMECGRADEIRGRDVGDAGFRSCSCCRQGEMLADHAQRGYVLLVRYYDRSIAEMRVTRRTRSSVATLIADGDGLVRRDSVLCLVRPSGAELTRGAGRLILPGRGTSSRLVYPSHTGHWDCRGLCSAGRTRLRGRTSPDASSIATDSHSRNPPPRGARFVPD